MHARLKLQAHIRMTSACIYIYTYTRAAARCGHACSVTAGEKKIVHASPRVRRRTSCDEQEEEEEEGEEKEGEWEKDKRTTREVYTNRAQEEKRSEWQKNVNREKNRITETRPARVWALRKLVCKRIIEESAFLIFTPPRIHADALGRERENRGSARAYIYARNEFQVARRLDKLLRRPN